MTASPTSLCVGGRLPAPAWAPEAPKDAAPLVWITLQEDGTTTVVMNKVEMGQGTSTAFAMLAAEELDLPLESIAVAPAPNAPVYNDPAFQAQLTGGSSSIQNMAPIIRQAAAKARRLLMEAAAARWGVPLLHCTTKDGEVLYPPKGRHIPYRELITEATALPLPGELALKPASQFKVISKCAMRLDLPDKVNGKATFGMDLRLPAMRYAAFAREPAYGAVASSWNDAKTLAIPGVEKVVETPLGIVVIATSTWAAWKGRQALEIVWSDGSNPDMDTASIEAELRGLLSHTGQDVKEAVHNGDVAAGKAQAAHTVDLEFYQPFLAHATLEPMNATAWVQDGKVEVWGPSQFQTGWAEAAAKAAGVPVEQVHIHTMLAGGGFGRKAEVDLAAMAVTASHAAGGPVQVCYDRTEDFRHDFYRPGNAAKVTAGVDADANLVFWDQTNASPSVLAHLLPMMLAETGVDFTGIEGADNLHYALSNHRLHWVRHDTPIPVGFWRSVGHSHNCFVRESVVDELARRAEKEPLAFRLQHLQESPRCRGVLELATARAGWESPLPEGRARGLAMDVSYGSWTATVVEVSLDRTKGDVTVHQVTTAIDCGLVVHPLAVTMQVEGALIMGLSAFFGEEVAFEQGGVRTKNFGDYPVLRMPRSPLAIEVHMVESEAPSGGVGEPGLPAVLPAMANAIRSLTGYRITKLPCSPKQLRKWLESTGTR